MIRPQRRVETIVRHQTPKVGRQSKLRLDINENIAGWPASTIEAVLATITPGDLAAYPETAGLYAAIARAHRLPESQVLVTAGSEMAIRYVFEAFLGPGVELLILEPSFAMFEVYGRMLGADVVKVPFTRRLEVSADQILARGTAATRIVAIANPNNPTGTVLSETDLLAIVRGAAAVGCLVLVDEAYFYFHPETLAPRVTEFDNLIVTRTFSKAFGLAGVRIGYALGASALIDAVQKVQPIDHASVFAVKFGRYAIEHEELAWEYARETAAGKAFLIAALRAVGLPVIDTHANFILVDLGSSRDRVLREVGDRVLLGATLRLPFPNDYAKITVGPVPQMEQLLEILRPALPTAAAGAGRVSR